MGIKGDDSDDEITGGATPQDSCADSEDTLTPLERSVTRRRLGRAEEKLATEYLDELCRFCKMPRIEIKTIDRMGGPLKWEASKEEVFPALAKLEKKYLVLQATSASSKRAFSQTGNIVTVKQSLFFLHSHQWV